jgi:hypothetical protein
VGQESPVLGDSHQFTSRSVEGGEDRPPNSAVRVEPVGVEEDD